MNTNDLYRHGIRRFGFWRRKMGYAGHALAIILFLSRKELAERWEVGRKEHGEMTDKEFAFFPAKENFREEMADGYWYHGWEEAQKRNA